MASYCIAICLIFILFSHEVYGAKEEIISEFECVDIHKQPAFQHPLLKNHKIQLRPSAELEKMLADKFPSKYTESSFDASDKVCPDGMVPIQKPNNNKTAFWNILDNKFPGQHFATLETKKDGTVYEGAVAKMSIHSPKVAQNQYSKAHIWIENGPSVLQAGWAVHPRIYGDSTPRFTIYWTGDGYQKTGCYNAVCSGFIQTSSRAFPGQPYTQIPKLGEQPVYTTISIFKDPTTKNWLLYQDLVNRVGYWPKEIVPSLDVGATEVRFGGNTYVSPDGISPEMGNGQFPNTDPTKTGHFIGNSLIANNEKFDIDGLKMNIYTDNRSCFKLQYFGIQIRELGPIFAYGGPGGQCGV